MANETQINTNIKPYHARALLVLFGVLSAAVGAYPGHALAASLFVSPGSGSFSVGTTFTVTVRTDTQGAAVNTAEANINFSTDTLELVRVVASPTFNLQAPGSPGKSNGTAYFGGGLPSPGFNGSGVVGSMVFRAVKEGSATVSIANGKVLANDGLGTNVLSATAGARYTIKPPPISAPKVVSATHPDPAQWYNKKDFEISWDRPSGAYGFSFDLDQVEDTLPDNVLDTTVTTRKTQMGLTDGIWYFHIKSRNEGGTFGPVTHFRILIDTTPPQPVEIKLVGQSNLSDVTRTPTIEFAAADALAGIDHYDIFLDDQFIVTVSHNPYTFSKLEPGPHTTKVVAYDRAGNTQATSLPIIVAGQPVEKETVTGIASLPLYVMVASNIILFLVILVLIWLLLQRKHDHSSVDPGIQALKREIDNNLDALKKHIDKRLQKIISNRPESKGKVTKLAVKINKDISRARGEINQDIGEKEEP